MKNKARNTDPISSHLAASKSNKSAKVHREIIRKALTRKPNQTARELERYIKNTYIPAKWIDYTQIMRRLNEVAIKGDLRECKTGMPCCRVSEWSLVRGDK